MASASSLPTVSLPLTALYSGAVGVLFALLSLRTFLYRGSKGAKAYFGDQNIPAAPKLQSVVRAQGNLAEYYAAFFVLFAVLEFNKVIGSTVLNGLGICFFLARLSHAFYMFSPDSIPPIPFRAFGFVGSFAPIAVASLYNVVYGFQNKY
ncbi:hypothetical protein WJX77_001212 [Trebouxia sp. C0004]